MSHSQNVFISLCYYCMYMYCMQDVYEKPIYAKMIEKKGFLMNFMNNVTQEGDFYIMKYT